MKPRSIERKGGGRRGGRRDEEEEEGGGGRKRKEGGGWRIGGREREREGKEQKVESPRARHIISQQGPDLW